MLFNPYQLAHLIYNKHDPVNLKALRMFFSLISQQLPFNSKIVLNIGSILFIILMNRVKDNFMITEQIKEYEKLNLDTETFDEHDFEKKYSLNSALSHT
jgi:hypothetical protein